MVQENQMPEIDWEVIFQAVKCYETNGYKYLEVPWWVNSEAMKVTFDGPVADVPLVGKQLVGSAEQSFIQMMMNDQLRPGAYVAATPCFRPSEKIDELHQHYFFKVELIHILNSSDDKCFEILGRVIDDALFFFNDVLGQKAKAELSKDSLGSLTETELKNLVIDITLNSIEIGSYGIREAFNYTWVYGTGIAEPRFSLAKKACL